MVSLLVAWLPHLVVIVIKQLVSLVVIAVTTTVVAVIITKPVVHRFVKEAQSSTLLGVHEEL